MKFLILIANALIYLQPYTKTLAPFLAGFALFASFESEEKQGFWLRLGLFSLFICLGTYGVFNWIIQPNFAGQVGPFPTYDLFLSSMFFLGGLAVFFVWLREGHPWLNSRSQKLVKRSAVERNKKTDVRFITDFLPPAQEQYDPTKHFVSGKFFLGLGEGSKPIYFTGETLPHVQVAATTGAGKGVFLGMIAAQCLRNGESVFWLDPKDDEYGPFVLSRAAEDAGKPFVLVDLRPAAGAQINFFKNSSKEQIEELFLGAFSLSEKGTDSDFYTIDDRSAASFVASQYNEGDTPASLFNRFGPELEVKAKKFHGLLREMAELASVNAQSGVDLRKIVKEGGAVYVIGSMRNAKVVRMQRMLLVKIIQLCEERDRTQGKPRPVCAVLDEAKYHISKPFLESLGAARDKGLHVILAHQALADLRDCPADLNADAVVGAVMENCSIKIVYRVEDPLTAEWLARKSGRIQVDDEVRRVIKNSALSETLNPERQIRQTERFLIDENMILNLHKRQAVVFGNGLPTFISTSPVQVKKSSESLKIQAVKGDSVITAAELI